MGAGYRVGKQRLCRVDRVRRDKGVALEQLSTKTGIGRYNSGMAIDAICVEGYRSVRHVYLSLGRVNVIVGANATGKTNLYRALYFLHRAAAGSLARAMAEEGGMPSILWAGARREGAVRMCVAVRTGDFSYHLECGLPTPESSLFHLDPEVKEENIFLHRGGKKVQLLGRKKAALLSPRPPELIALNEPEASIHPDLLGALGGLIVKASARTQLWITTHSMQLAEKVRGQAECRLVQLEKVDGETRVLGQSELERAMEV